MGIIYQTKTNRQTTCIKQTPKFAFIVEILELKLIKFVSALTLTSNSDRQFRTAEGEAGDDGSWGGDCSELQEIERGDNNVNGAEGRIQHSRG